MAKTIQIYDSHNVHEYDAALLEHRSAFVGAVLREWHGAEFHFHRLSAA